MRVFILILLSLLTLFLAVNSGEFLSIGNLSLKPIIIFLYFITLYWNPYYGLFAGFFLGFFYEISLPVLTGTYPLILTSLSFGLGMVEKNIFKFRYKSLILLFSSVFIIGLLQTIFEVNKMEGIFRLLFTNIIPEAGLNTAVGFVILYFIKFRSQRCSIG